MRSPAMLQHVTAASTRAHDARLSSAAASCSASAVPPRQGCGNGRRDAAGGEKPLQFGRRSAVGGAAGALLLAAQGPAWAADSRLQSSAPLWERLEARQLDKPVFNIPPREQEYPEWLEGTWDATVTFEGYAFPSKTIDKKRLIADTTIPGFIKLSIVYIPDVGSGANFKMRYRRRGGPGSPVVEDRAANITSIVEGYLKRPGELIEAVECKEANRTTVAFKQGSNNNAERIELFTNARESALRESDGVFFALESLRQVTLGYSTQYNAPRVAIGDYLHVWSFRRIEDGVIRARISTAAFVQPNDALKYTNAPGSGPGGPSAAPVPQLGGLLSVSTEPAVLYSHTVMLRKAQDPVAV